MPYKVLQQEVTLLEKIGEIRSADNEHHLAWEHRSHTYFKDEIVEDEKLSPVVKDAYEAGDAHTRHLIKKLTAAQVKRLQKGDDDVDVDEDQE